jgi:hypothetical protein
VQNYRKEEEGRGVLVNNNRIGGKRLDFTSRSGENSVLEQPGISRGTANDSVLSRQATIERVQVAFSR